LPCLFLIENFGEKNTVKRDCLSLYQGCYLQCRQVMVWWLAFLLVRVSIVTEVVKMPSDMLIHSNEYEGVLSKGADLIKHCG
jgi:hypothetical protein